MGALAFQREPGTHPCMKPFCLDFSVWGAPGAAQALSEGAPAPPGPPCLYATGSGAVRAATLNCHFPLPRMRILPYGPPTPHALFPLHFTKIHLRPMFHLRSRPNPTLKTNNKINKLFSHKNSLQYLLILISDFLM